jgi:hypothetical protein
MTGTLPLSHGSHGSDVGVSRLSLFVAILSLAMLTLVGCSAGAAPQSGVRVLILVPSNPRVGNATIDIMLQQADGAPVEGATVRVRGDMTEAGMVPVIRPATEVAPGRYAVDGFAFTMAGDWVISVEGTLADGRQLTGSLDVRGVAR